MGYRIQYGPAGKAETIWIAGKGKTRRSVIAAMIVAAALTAGCLFAGREKVYEILVPGDAEVTKAAFGRFTDNLQMGESFGDAMVVFCKEIIESAEGME